MARKNNRVKYVQYKQGMRDLMSVDPIAGFVGAATAGVQHFANGFGHGDFGMRLYVTSANRQELISMHGEVYTEDAHAFFADKKYDILSHALSSTKVNYR